MVSSGINAEYMGTCCWKMMVDRGWSVSISSFLVSATFVTWINTDLTGAQKISNAMLDDILGDIASQYQSADYGGMDYNDLMQDETPSMYKDADAVEPRSLKQSHNSKGPIKNSMLPAYCDPPNPCPIGYTAEDGCIEMFENKAEFSRKYQASQNCMCDTEHMFSCPDATLSNIYKKQQDAGLSYFGFPDVEDVNNPFLSGTKLPIAAKKGMNF
eukprot:TRINITY_DN2752_c0_g1_i1.p1 TRINITY_DN2752_c0_g1~~TRINITY_DN2752_c0_g1_i1.p1  ORF type:complete len:214 (+),score=55.66 TRINITY_DN2752_c0_g1_i1:413-1054(+)